MERQGNRKISAFALFFLIILPVFDSMAAGSGPGGPITISTSSAVSIEEVVFEPQKGIEGSVLERTFEPGGACSIKVRFVVNDPELVFVTLHYNVFSDVFEFGYVNPSHYYNPVLHDTVRVSAGTLEHTHCVPCRVVGGGYGKVIANVTIKAFSGKVLAYASREIPVEITPLKAPSGEMKVSAYMVEKYDVPVVLVNDNPVAVSAELIKVMLDNVTVNERTGGIFSTPIYGVEEWLPHEAREFSLAKLLNGKLPRSPGNHTMRLVWSMSPVNGMAVTKISEIMVFFRPLPNLSLFRGEYDIEGINSTHLITMDIHGEKGFKLTDVKATSSSNCTVDDVEVRNWTLRLRIRGLEEGLCRLTLYPTLEDEQGIRLDMPPLKATVHVRKSLGETFIMYLPYIAVALILTFMVVIIKKLRLLGV